MVSNTVTVLNDHVVFLGLQQRASIQLQNVCSLQLHYLQGLLQ